MDEIVKGIRHFYLPLSTVHSVASPVGIVQLARIARKTARSLHPERHCLKQMQGAFQVKILPINASPLGRAA